MFQQGFPFSSLDQWMCCKVWHIYPVVQVSQPHNSTTCYQVRISDETLVILLQVKM